MNVRKRLEKYLCPPDGKTFRTVLIVGPPESGKTTTAASLSEFVIANYAKLGKKAQVFFLDKDARIPQNLKLNSLEEVMDCIINCTTPVLVMNVTDPGMGLSFLFASRKALGNFINNIWQARHLNPNLQHLILMLGCQTITGITQKLRSLGLILVIKGAGGEDVNMLHAAGVKINKHLVSRVTEMVFANNAKDVGLIVFPNLPYCVVRFKYPSFLFTPQH